MDQTYTIVPKQENTGQYRHTFHHQQMSNIYPNSVPEFRILRKPDGTQRLQVRYVNTTVGYRGSWADVPVVDENLITEKN